MDDSIKQHLLERVHTNPYVNYLEIDFQEIEEGRVVARMPLKPEQRQYSGVIHGGILAAFADTVAGFAAYTMTPSDFRNTRQQFYYLEDSNLSNAEIIEALASEIAGKNAGSSFKGLGNIVNKMGF